MGLPKNRAANRSKRRETRAVEHQALIRSAQEETTRRPAKPRRIAIEPITEAQRHYDTSIRVNTITFGIGPAGTGKTWLATMRAAEMLATGEVEKLIITRPAVEAGENLGFMPGTQEDKWAPYFAPVRRELEAYFGSGHLEYLIKAGAIETAPLAFLRGHTFKNSIVLFDEAQNATIAQMKMFLTRIGEDSRVIIEGDPRQNDLPRGQVSGLEDAMRRLRRIKSVGVVEFDIDDIVRSGICREIVLCYLDYDARAPTASDDCEEPLAGLRRTIKTD